MEWGTGPISQMGRLRLQEGRDLSEVTTQPSYLRQLAAGEARLDSKDFPLAAWAPSAGMKGRLREGLPVSKWMKENSDQYDSREGHSQLNSWPLSTVGELGLGSRVDTDFPNLRGCVRVRDGAVGDWGWGGHGEASWRRECCNSPLDSGFSPVKWG